MTRVSVIIPTYNRAHMVVEAVRSVLEQDHDDLELIVIDDGSTDGTREVLSSYLDRMTYVYQENREKSAAKNRGIGLASGKYLSFLDSDDLYLPGKIAHQTRELDSHPDHVMVYSDAIYMEKDGTERKVRNPDLSGRIYPGILLNITNFHTPTIMTRTSLVREMGGFNENITIHEDWDLWRRMARKGPVLQTHEYVALIRKGIRRSDPEFLEENVEHGNMYISLAREDDPDLERSVLRMLRFKNLYVAARRSYRDGLFDKAREYSGRSLSYVRPDRGAIRYLEMLKIFILSALKRKRGKSPEMAR